MRWAWICRRAGMLCWAVAIASASGRPVAAEPSRPVSLQRIVIPALTKAGCNAGACHGSFQGRGGFSLSLLGFDPAADYEAIAKDARGRRVSIAAPDQSLILRKALAQMPHGGGQRIAPGSPTHQLLRTYIAQGLPPPLADEPRIVGLNVSPPAAVLQPGESAAVQVTANWSDGSTSDATLWALFDSRDESICEVSAAGIATAKRPGKSPLTVRFSGQVAAVDVTVPFAKIDPYPDFPAANYIDELVVAEWKRVGLLPAARASDEAFLRRLSLDLIGTLPTPDEIGRFAADSQPDKRRRMIDSLLERPEYASYWSIRWGDLLRVHRRYVGDKGLASFSGWLRQSLRENRPLDRLTRELLTAQGNVFQYGPAAYFFIDEKPEDLAETTAQVFLGVRMQCARCHHHPMEVWGQDDYYGLAAFFTRLEIKQPKELGASGRFGGSRIIRAIATESPNRSLKVPSPPRLLGQADQPSPAADSPADIRASLADWVARPENPYFARNFANRYWAWLMGRGLVEPVDDLRATNPPSNPALLDALAKDFAEHGFDGKHLLRTICNSNVYQLAAEFEPARDADGLFYTHHVPRRMIAEVALDAVNQATGATESFAELPPGTRAIELPDPFIPSDFLTTFGRSLRNNPCECGRENQPDLTQALQLINNADLQTKLAAADGRVVSLLKANRPDAEIIDELYLATFSRLPTESERQAVLALVAAAPSRQEGFEDLLWSLLNSAEFIFNH